MSKRFGKDRVAGCECDFSFTCRACLQAAKPYTFTPDATFESGRADVVAAALGVPVEFLNCEPSTASEVHLQVLQERRGRLMSRIRASDPCPDCMEMRLAEAVVDLESNCICPPPPEKFDDLPEWVGRNKHKKPR